MKYKNQINQTKKTQIRKTASDCLPLNAVVANKRGDIFDLEDYGAVGMSGNEPLLMTRGKTIDMPYGSELMMLPNTKPLVFNFDRGKFEILHENPYQPGEEIFPVAIFNSPGYVNRYFCAYEHCEKDFLLPLFSYGACGWSDRGDKESLNSDGGSALAGAKKADGFMSAAICVDTEPRQDLRLMPHDGIVAGVEAMRLKYPDNRLMRHLEKCALVYGCPAAKNFFLGRYEAPIPTSKVCNANCLGCISLQVENNLMACQDRISFIPEPLEIAQVALEHLPKVKSSVASFGQGCEGDPLTAFYAIEPALRLIREQIDTGTINMNTNAGMPDKLSQLFDAGLDSVRVSMNSVRESCYNAYFRPRSYTYSDVIRSIEIAGKKDKFVSINYLNCPGVTDSEMEFTALKEFLLRYPVNMIQWRNMNYDPLSYLKIMEQAGGTSPALGMDRIIKELEGEFPKLRHGYFNPPNKNVK
ncbi:MAG: radical SAM protein [Desulfamplus sp.]|nr:radical SAM protein [Desulfamplus sp.]